MDPLDTPRDSQLIEAVLLWTGWGRSQFPLRDRSALVRRFGVEDTLKLLSTLEQLEEDFYTSDARVVAADLKEMETLCAVRFRERNPGVAEDIVRAFAWCYTFDFK